MGLVGLYWPASRIYLDYGFHNFYFAYRLILEMSKKIKKTHNLDISFIVVSFKNAAILDLCVKSILEEVSGSGKDKKIRGEVLIVDSMAGEKTRDVAKKYILDRKPVRYFPFRENSGFSRAVNKGIEKSRGKLLFILNSDIILTEKSLRPMMEYAQSHKKTGILGPKLLNFDGSPQPSAFHFYTPEIILYRRTFLGKTGFGRRKLKEFVINTSRVKSKPFSINGWLMGSALLLRRDNLEKIGPMDDRYFMYFEDVDWCRRFIDAGYEVVYFPKSALFHYHGKQSATRYFWDALFNRMTLIHIQSAVQYFMKFRGK